MKVVLPSCGALGTRSVDLRPIRFEDLREIQNLSQDPNLCKIEFMHRLLPGVDFHKITRWDLKYLYNLSVFAVTYNTIEFDTKCPDCGETIKSVQITISGMDVKTLDMHDKITKEINGVTYTYHLLSAQDYEDALVYAAPAEDEQKAYENAIVALTLYGDVEKATEVGELPAIVYMSAFMFQQMAFHGITLKQAVTCPTCHKEFNCVVSVPLETIKIDVAKIMECYASMADTVSFADFNNMTVPEYDHFVKSFNERVQNV